MATSPTKTARAARGTSPTKRAAAAPARGGRRPGPNRATVRRRELESELNRPLAKHEVEYVKKNPTISTQDFTAYVQREAGMTGGSIVGDEPPALADVIHHEFPATFLDSALRNEAEASVRLDGETYSVDHQPQREYPEYGAAAKIDFNAEPELTLIRVDGDGNFAVESPASVLIIDARQPTPNAERIGVLLDYLAEFKRTPAVEQTMKELYGELGARIGV